MIHKAKKSMGQNFLKSKEALFKMCEAGDVNNNDIVVEIGPGKGVLTEKLLEKAKNVIAIEKDRDLIDILKDKFANEIKEGKLILLNEDILEFNPKTYNLEPETYKIIANIPYNITGSIIRRFLSEVNRPNTMTLLVQKEVAERIVARDNKESILSLSIKAYGEPKYIMKVHKRFFSPSPKVDSAIISINNISNKVFKDKKEEESFFRLIKAGFAHKRKVLRKNLEDLNIKEVGLPYIDEIFNKLEIDTKVRAEDVPFKKWLKIRESFDKNA
ncbi:MAG: Ribosomal RNA small subunit methyltransferase A [Candidatus Nomurabacteria bacterium GW2011_GWF2_35_66]|uniref:Ribosomal RNA small subunit methyltransferase A n=1 Tax=Candidatus Nomurabacteria bacterium GW2011_GWE1_35_16 TaxID=1618761 RepID=A0A0G0BB50_9BACT|nr:MAG: Ribosomal RNA small subunit methyltransferase A [Candidatus Nomurabacteria bacterium GW2011_GWF1_34_20]KKP63473.1 MAG: Ribosomal RNA small subunit methyltransferase A [Candidatus Nomurabacteria bacterium GW2011_GWE2_34_25]KKP66653.1 MAG: Ribosomal RNA small subunit methyltransferase A [Candidatus Nomurabacteria bacterium GW2011_GWE1_35_16]KKP83761.1 MAG: Ribosomal RNA small subunit methyltransferase A [Candidatus Nomurabacteria bacterium GW2011_GWF2_35_66]HAE36452.1 ribosomal RNA small 